MADTPASGAWEEDSKLTTQDLLDSIKSIDSLSNILADKIEVFSKAYGEDKAYIWVSDTSDGYEILETEMANHGTMIVLHLKANFVSLG